MSSKKKIWNNILLNLENDITKSDVDTWFSKTELSKFDDTIAIIEVPNKFVATWIRDNFNLSIHKFSRKSYR